MSKRLTQQEFINKATAVHGDKYDYSKTVYTNTRTKVNIICPIHGEFEQLANDHINGSGCKKCANIIIVKKTSLGLEKFIQKAKLKHPEKYTYEKVVYVNNKVPVIITCPIHGEFEQRPDTHLNGCGCPNCGGTGKLTTKEFVIRAIKQHGLKYNYEKVQYVNAITKITITCLEHGDFEQLPADHIAGCDCPKCANDNKAKAMIKSQEDYITELNNVHNNKYDYSLVKYNGAIDSITIICPEHGSFEQNANSHLRGRGCPSCAKSGFDPMKSGYLYYLKVTSDKGEILYKIGITNLSINKRFTPADRDKIEVIKLTYYKIGVAAYNEEQRILKEYKEFKYTGADVLSSGNTELFTKDVLGLDTPCIIK